MAKGEFRIKNTDNFTVEQIIGQPVEFKYKDNNPIPLGIVSKVDQDYIYIEYEHNNDEDMTIEFNKDVSFSMEIAGD